MEKCRKVKTCLNLERTSTEKPRIKSRFFEYQFNASFILSPYAPFSSSSVLAAFLSCDTVEMDPG